MFKQAKQNRAFEDIIVQLQESILEGKLKPGDKLPGERQLREIFKVSRGTLREALRALEQKKLIQIKTGAGGGTVICPVNIQPVSDSLDLLLRYQKISLRELAEFREAVEGLVAARAALKAKKEDINQLNAILESIKKHLDSGMFEWDEIMREDSKFHLYLATIAGNRVFESVLFTIYDNINRYFNQFLPRTNRIFLNIYKDLFNITQAIKERDSNKALAIVQNHVKKFNRMMETGEKGQKGQKGKAAIHEE